MIARTSGRLFRDSHPSEQPDNTYRYALNAVAETRDGDLSLISTERGFSSCVDLPLDPVGYVYLGNDDVLLFLTDDTNHEIGLLDRNCNYTTLYANDCLNFNRKYLVQATYRLRLGCQRTIYFTDGVNPVRVIDIDNLPATCDDLSLVRGFTLPCFVEKRVNNSGGSLQLGSYEFAIRYLDAALNPTAWFYTSRSVLIYDEPTTASYTQIDGGFNTGTDPVNGVASVSKSISLSLSGLDSNFTFYQVAIVARTSGTGEVSEVLVSPPQPIQKTQFVFNGNTDGYETTTLESVQIKPVSVESAQHIEQLENRLILANIKGRKIDVSALQRAASQITSKYTVKQVRADEVVPGNAKHPNTDDVGYMGDEVYAFGIVYVYNDGYESPVFHIPGRASNTFDTELLTVTALGGTPTTVALDDVKHLGLQIGDTVERYRVYNTADTDDNLMAYHQNTDVYPDIRDCDGNSIWGTDAQGNELIGTPIRHHRFPDRKKVQVLDKILITIVPEDRLNILGVEFSNIAYPDSNIVGHYIVRGERTSTNRTVVDKGFIRNLTTARAYSEEPTRVIGSLFQSSQASPASRRRTWSDDEVYFLGASTLVREEIPQGSHYKVEYALPAIQRDTEQDSIELESSTFFNRDFIVIGGQCLQFGEGQVLDFENRAVAGSRIVGINTTVTPTSIFTNPIRNRAGNQAFYVSKINGTIEEASYPTALGGPYSFIYVALKNAIDVFADLFNITYLRTHDCVRVNDGEYFGGDTFISPLNTLVTFFDAENDPNIEGVALYDAFTSAYVESDINISLRNDVSTCSRYLRECGEAFNTARDATLSNDDGGWNLRPFPCQYPWSVNPDLSSVGNVDLYFPLPLTFNFCSQCFEEFPNRVVYSSQSFQEEQADNYRLFLANNYRDIEAEFGEVTAVVRRGNELLIWTPDTLFLLPSSYQERVTQSGIVTFIGTGSFFEIPPRIVSEAETGSAGTLDKWAIRKTEQGIFFLDSRSGKPYLFGESLQPLNEGMKSWFEERMPNTISRLLGTDYRSPYYWGAISAYDRRFDRILLTYKDFELKAEWGGLHGDFVAFEQPSLGYNTTTEQFFTYDARRGTQVIELGDPDWFCDTSWTMSFSLTSGWTSWHSYIPEFYITTKSDVFAAKDGLWRMNSGDFSTYFGVKQPHVIEFVIKSEKLQTAISESLSVIADVRKDGSDTHEHFFNKILLYNSRQSTGLQNIVLSGTLDASQMLIQRLSDGIGCTRRRRNWEINGFRNNVTGPLFLSECTDFTQTDKIPAPATNVAWYELERLDDKYVVIRLIYDAQENIQITTQYGLVNLNPTE